MSDRLSNVIVRTLPATGDKGARECSCLFDTGASDSFVSRELATLIGTIAPLPLDQRKHYGIADGSYLTPEECVPLTLTVNGRAITDTFIINPAPGASLDDVILGASTMEKYGMSVDMKRRDVFFRLTTREVSMDEKLKRALAALGITEFAPDLNDEGAIALIGQHARPTPAVTTALELPIAAPESDVIATIHKLRAASLVVATPSVLKALQLPTEASEEETLATIHVLTHPVSTVTREEQAALEKRVQDTEIETAISTALSTGFTTPKERESLLTMASDAYEAGKSGAHVLKLFFEKRGKVTPVGARVPPPPTGARVIDDLSSPPPFNPQHIYAAREKARLASS